MSAATNEHGQHVEDPQHEAAQNEEADGKKVHKEEKEEEEANCSGESGGFQLRAEDGV